MSAADMMSLLPLVILAAGSILVLLMAAFLHRLLPAFLLTAGVTTAALVFACISWADAPFTVGALLSFDRFVCPLYQIPHRAHEPAIVIASRQET